MSNIKKVIKYFCVNCNHNQLEPRNSCPKCNDKLVPKRINVINNILSSIPSQGIKFKC